jgi:hypothetical protein
MPRKFSALLPGLVLAAIAAPRSAAENEAPRRPIGVALGIKTGVIPPALAAPELVVHAEHALLGLFGMALGGDTSRTTLGGELGYEFTEFGLSTPYLLGALFHYDSTTHATGAYERSDMFTLTGGYEWKGRHVELQLGGGVLFLLHDELPPCTGWGCIRITIPVLPTFDLALRYRF